MRETAGPAADARAPVEACLELWPQASLAGIDSTEAVALSWRLSGLTVVADWVGSNPEWFPPAAAPTSPAVYLAQTRSRAACAVAKAGLLPPAPANARLFDFALRPMQEAAVSIPLRDGPILAVIEDETGADKTEAALLLPSGCCWRARAGGYMSRRPPWRPPTPCSPGPGPGPCRRRARSGRCRRAWAGRMR